MFARAPFWFALFLLACWPAAAQPAIRAPERILLGKGVKVGYRCDSRVKAGKRQTEFFMAVVGETKDAWEIETNLELGGFSPIHAAKGLVLALVVDKKTGKVLIAKVGVPGKPLEDLDVPETDDDDEAPKPKPKSTEDYTLPSGKKIRAELFEAQGVESYYGASGTPLAGVLLAVEGQSPMRLNQDPKQVDYELSDVDEKGRKIRIKATLASYSDGMNMLYPGNHAVAKALGVKTLSCTYEGYTYEVLSLRKDATKTLKWTD